MSFRRISILGLGLMGGSVALAIRRHISECSVTGYDINPGILDDAQSGGAIDHGTSDLMRACQGAQCVVICVPVGEVCTIMTTIGPYLEPAVCVTDVSSTKHDIQNAAEKLLPAGVHFVGAHPMAGREVSGFAAARADLFEGAVCITTPTPTTDANALAQIESMWQALGSRIVRLSPEAHDRAVAQISHLPHLLASALINFVTDEALAIAGPGFRDSTRIAAGSASLWRQILLANATELRASMASFREELDAVEQLLDGHDGPKLEAWLARAAGRRSDLT